MFLTRTRKESVFSRVVTGIVASVAAIAIVGLGIYAVNYYSEHRHISSKAKNVKELTLGDRYSCYSNKNIYGDSEDDNSIRYSYKAGDCKSEYDASGWWALKREKIENSKADYWVFVMPEFRGERKVSSCSFVILTPKELINRLTLIHEKNQKKDKPYNMYLTVKGDVAIETRGASIADRNRLFEKPAGHRNFSGFLNRWEEVLSKVCSKKV